MKNIVLLFTLFSIVAISCAPKEYPSENCRLEYSFNGIDYLKTDIVEYTSVISDSHTIICNFDDGASINIIVNDWVEEEGTLPATFFIYEAEPTGTFIESGDITVTNFGGNYFEATFVDENNFITNGSMVLRYSDF